MVCRGFSRQKKGAFFLEIYLDNCATTRVCPQAAEACLKAMTADYGNPSSLHRKGMEAEAILTAARKTVAWMLSCPPESVLFTANATESNNLAILGSAAARPHGGRTIVTTAVEHSSVANAAAFLEKKGYTVKRVAPRSDGHFAVQDFLDALDPDTLLVSFMMVNNEVGTVLPYETLIPALRRKAPRVLIHMDAVQGFGKYPLNLKRLDLDFLSFSGHKLYAPKGIGVLYLKKGVRIAPLAYGGGQESNLRPGTQAVELAAGLNEALLLCQQEGKEWAARCASLNRRLREGLAALPRVKINSPEDGAPHILNLSVLGIRSEILLHFLEERGIYVSSGSACSKGAKSPALAAYGLTPEEIDSAIRVSFSKDTTEGEIDALLAALSDAIAKLRPIIEKNGKERL